MGTEVVCVKSLFPTPELDFTVTNTAISVHLKMRFATPFSHAVAVTQYTQASKVAVRV